MGLSTELQFLSHSGKYSEKAQNSVNSVYVCMLWLIMGLTYKDRILARFASALFIRRRYSMYKDFRVLTLHLRESSLFKN